MSSHHFVREGQEPALLIIEPLSLELIEPLLEWAPVVLVLDTAMDEVIKWKIKIDVVIVRDNTRILLEEKLADQGPVKTLDYFSDEEVVRTTVDFLREQRHTGINLITNATEKVYDQWLKEIGALDIVIITDKMKWSAVASEFEKWLPEGVVVFIRSAHESSLLTTGLTAENISGRFKTERDGIILIKSTKPFWVGESL